MRFLLPFAATCLCLPAMAQTDAGQVVSHSPNVGQVQVEDDNDPFVPNAFTGSFRMEMHRFRDGVEDKNGPMNMLYWSSPDKTLMAMPRPDRTASDMKVLTDLKNKWTYMLMTDSKGNRTAMKSRKKKYNFPQEGNGDDHMSLTKTGETKTIDGHLCTKYIAQTDDGTWTGWVARDIALPFKDIAGGMNRSAMQRNREDWSGMEGFPLEFEMVDKDGHGKSVVYVKDLNIGAVDPGVFSMDGYRTIEVPGVSR